MKILAKSIIDKNNIIDKVRKGCNNLEIQLFSDFINKNNDELVEEIKSVCCNVFAVHMPLIDSEEVNLEYFTNDRYEELFFKVCEFSQMLADCYKHEITIIIHNGFSLPMYEKIPELFYTLIEIFDTAIDEYKNINFAFENILPFIIKKDIPLISRSGFLNENAIIAKFFNENCIKSVFGTVLDTCHAMITMRILNKLFDEEPVVKDKKYDLEYYFRENKDTIKVIHLANVEELGYKPLQHGAPFLEQDINILKEIMNLYEKYSYECFITIEVFEKDYLNSVNFLKTKENLERVFYKFY
ncbi:MAG: hypothetical protein K0R54_234 [Clostridiaceae bacterium]|nr:hypothetical protein [Clostridiaceae bacterium]